MIAIQNYKIHFLFRQRINGTCQHYVNGEAIHCLAHISLDNKMSHYYIAR
jgi:hypothetical protein